jgi:hypothetical protein
MSTDAVTPLRHRMIEDMNARKLSVGTQRGHIHSCKRFAAFLNRSPVLLRSRKFPVRMRRELAPKTVNLLLVYGNHRRWPAEIFSLLAGNFSNRHRVSVPGRPC